LIEPKDKKYVNEISFLINNHSLKQGTMFTL